MIRAWPALVFLFAATPAEPALSRFTYEQPHMGTKFALKLYATDQTTADRASHAAFARIAALNKILSDYDADSEAMRLCKQAGGLAVPVSTELFFVLQRGREVFDLSNGAFDVTVGPVVKLWRRARKTSTLPDAKALAEARELVGYKLVELDATARTVRLAKAGMSLDFGGIAKGYAADEALAVLKAQGISRALVAASGDITVSGSPPDAEGWKVAVQDPGGAALPKQLLLRDAAVSTSGDLNQYVEINGVRYSHIVDPRTGVGLVGRMSATVVARRGIDADSHTKIVAVLGADGLKIIDKLDYASAQFIRRTDADTLTATSRYPFPGRFAP